MKFARTLILALVASPLMAPTELFAEQPALAEIFANTTHPVKVVCFGDSVTGLYYHTGGRRAYTDMLQIALRRAYPEADIQAINAGISGNTCADGLRRIKKDVLNHKPDLVTVMFSLNDMTRGQPLSTFEAQLLDIIKQCQDIGASVMLCTPNSVMDTPSRPTVKLEKYVAAIRNIAKQHNLPLADCYAAYQTQKEKNEWEWSMLMSDEIHPNMGGHKLIAETISAAISGKNIALTDVAALQPAIPFTLKRLQAGEPVKILAMPPYDTIVAETIKKIHPDAKLEVTPWLVEGKSTAEIDASAAQVRAGGYQLVIIAVPWQACPRKIQSQLRNFSWVLNKSLSFGRLEWDCIAITPTVKRPAANNDEQVAYAITRQFMLNQDLTVIDRPKSHPTIAAKEIFANWWATQLAP